MNDGEADSFSKERRDSVANLHKLFCLLALKDKVIWE